MEYRTISKVAGTNTHGIPFTAELSAKIEKTERGRGFMSYVFIRTFGPSGAKEEFEDDEYKVVREWYTRSVASMLTECSGTGK